MPANSTPTPTHLGKLVFFLFGMFDVWGRNRLGLGNGLEGDTDDLDDASVQESGKNGHLPFVTDGGIVICEECGSFSI